MLQSERGSRFISVIEWQKRGTLGPQIMLFS